jgi:hypothetical protein
MEYKADITRCRNRELWNDKAGIMDGIYLSYREVALLNKHHAELKAGCIPYARKNRLDCNEMYHILGWTYRTVLSEYLGVDENTPSRDRRGCPLVAELSRFQHFIDFMKEDIISFFYAYAVKQHGSDDNWYGENGRILPMFRHRKSVNGFCVSFINLYLNGYNNWGAVHKKIRYFTCWVR